MSDKLLHSVPISSNVEEYDGSGSGARGAGGGFPCQARIRCLFFELEVSQGLWLALQDVSQAGTQSGLGGERSVLVKEVFRTFDTLDEGWLGAKC